MLARRTVGRESSKASYRYEWLTTADREIEERRRNYPARLRGTTLGAIS
jgi:hypothetical protein